MPVTLGAFADSEYAVCATRGLRVVATFCEHCRISDAARVSLSHVSQKRDGRSRLRGGLVQADQRSSSLLFSYSFSHRAISTATASDSVVAMVRPALLLM